jgi:membrane protein DedA with SNARE-associated domain
MSNLFTILLSFVLLYKYVALFIIVFLSGLILPLPSNTLILALGAFASQGYMNVTLIFIVSLASNVLGDCVGYALTRSLKMRNLIENRLKHFSTTARLKEFIEQYAGWTILITRFLGTLGVVVNFLAGLLDIPFQYFLLYDTIGNALTIACFVFVGYGLGVYTEAYSDITKLLGWIILIIILIFMLIKMFLHKKKKD